MADESRYFTPTETPASPQAAEDSGMAPTPALTGAGGRSYFAPAESPAATPVQSYTSTLPTTPPSYFKPPTPYGPPVGQNPSVVPPSGGSTWDFIKDFGGKALDWANASFMDPEPIKRWTGWEPESGWGKGLLHGVEDLIRGVDSPLGLAFLIGSWGVGGLFESAGSAALRSAGAEAGLGLADVAEVTKGSQIIAQAMKNGRTEEQAMKMVAEQGLDAEKVEAGLKKLADSGLTAQSLASKGLIHDAGSSLLRRIPGVSIAQAENINTGIHALINLGFTYTNAVGAAMASARVFDALKEGNYEDAARFGVDALGGGAFAALGAHQGIKTVGHFMPELAAKMGLRNSPSMENANLINEFGKHAEAIKSGQREMKLKADAFREKYPELNNPVDHELLSHAVQAGGDDRLMAERYNALAESAGRPFRLPLPGEGAELQPALAARAARVSPEDLLKKYGRADNLRETAFIDKDGVPIKLPPGLQHEDMIRPAGTMGGEGLRQLEGYLNDTGTVRTRFEKGRQGETLHVSLPLNGVTEEQAARIRSAAGEMRYGNIVLEQAAEHGRSAYFEFPTAVQINHAIENLAGIKGEPSALAARGLLNRPATADHVEERFRPMLDEILLAHNSTGGSTFNIHSGSLAGKDVYAVSIFPERTQVLNHEPTRGDIASYIQKNADLLHDPRASFGSWKNPDTGEHVFDISATTPSRAEAETLGKKYDQQSITYLKDFTNIPVGGTGGGKFVASIPAEQRLAEINHPNGNVNTVTPQTLVGIENQRHVIPENLPGAEVSKPALTYNEATSTGTNPWVRKSANPADTAHPDNSRRTLMVQFASDLIHKVVAKDEAENYYDKLYSGAREGFGRPQDFWEIPKWISEVAHTLPNSDVYVIRDIPQAKAFLEKAGYGRVAFSALDLNKDLIREVVKDYKGHVDVGGYINKDTFSDLPNVKWHDTVESLAKDSGVPYRQGADYRHFEGTSDVIPRLTLSDGCLHRCAFCAVPQKLDVTPRPLVDQQVEAISKLGAKLVYLNDKTFGQANNYQNLSEIYQKMRERNPNFQGFVVQTTAAQMQKIPMEWLQKSGIKFVELGIESYNDPLLKAMHKPATEALINKAADKLREANIALIPNILVGYPGETPETYAHTLEWLKNNKDIISHANIYNIAVYENTELGKQVGTMSPSDFNENVLEKSFHTEPEVHRRFAGELYGLAEEMLNGTPRALKLERDLKLSEEPGSLAARRRLESIDDIPRGSTVPLLQRPLAVHGEPTVENVGAALQNYTAGTMRMPVMELAATNPKAMLARAVRLGSSELNRMLAEENSGVGWYSEDIDTMHRELGKLHPELNDNPDRRGFVNAIAAASSLGNESLPTIKLVDEIYSLYKKTGTIPAFREETDLWGNPLDWGSAHSNANRNVLMSLQRILDHNGGDPDAAYRWMLEKHPVSKLREVKQVGQVSGKAADERYGAYALSPKAGAFFLNMSGVPTELTMDKWASRTWNRWMGTLVKEDGSVQEAPRNQGERELATKAFDEMRKPFGLEVNEAQAVLWYYEQKLWKAHGLNIDEGVSYGDAAKRYVANELRTREYAEARGEAADRGPAAERGAVPAAGGEGAREVSRGDLAGTEEGDVGFDPEALAARPGAGNLEKQLWRDRNLARAQVEVTAPTESRPGYITVNRYAGQALGMEKKGWVAVTFPRNQTNMLLEDLEALRNEPFMLTDARAKIDQIREAIGKLQETNKPIIFVHQGYEQYLPHEFTHVHQYELGAGLLAKHIDVDAAYYHKYTQAAANGLARNSGYSPDMGKTEAVAEIAAHILTGEGHLTDLTPEEQNSWVANYLEEIAVQHGPEGALKVLREAVDRFNPEREAYAQKLAFEQEHEALVVPEKERQPALAAREPTVPRFDRGEEVEITDGEFAGQRGKIYAGGKGLYRIDFGGDQHANIPAVYLRRIGEGAEPAGLAAREPRKFRETDDDRKRELINQHNLQNSEHYKTPEDIDRLLNSYDYRRLTPQHRAAVKELGDWFKLNFDKAHKAGVLNDKQWVEDYLTNLWAKDANNPAANRLRHAAGTGEFAINTPMALHRTFANAFEGELLGKKLAVTDPVALAAFNGARFSDVANSRALFDRLQDLNIRASDGRPMLAPSGTGHVVEGEEGENPSAFVNPRTTRSILISDHVAKGLEQSGDLKRLLDEGTIVKKGKNKEGVEKYAWNPGDYFELNHPGLRAWKFMTQSPDGTQILQKSDLKVHPEFFPYLRRRLGMEPSPLQESGIGRGALAISREAKGSLLAFSPFHLAQEGLRAIMTGISPVGIEKWSLHNAEWAQGTDGVVRPSNDAAKLSLGVRHGLTLDRDYKSVESFQEGQMMSHSKIIGKIPGLGRMQNWMNEFLFQKYIPSLKARAFKSLFDRYGEAHPDWTQEKVAHEAAYDTNSRFGGLDYKGMGRAVATQDLFRLVALAPDWLESEMRFMGRLFGSEGDIARKDVVRMTLGMWAAARVLNYVVSGQPHHEAPFGVALRGDDGREKVYSMRTLPTDLLHAATDPTGFISGRVAPMAKSVSQAITGTDERGHRIPSHELYLNMLRNAAPISLQNAGKALTGETPDVTSLDQVIKAAGGTVHPYKTEAQKVAGQIASDHSEIGQVDPAVLRRHQAVLRIEDEMRAGRVQMSDLNQMVVSGALSPAHAKQVLENAKQTTGLDGDMARLYSEASRAPMPEFLRVWSVATLEERNVLSKLLLKKRMQYIKHANKEYTPAERAADPTLRQLQQLFPQQAMF